MYLLYADDSGNACLNEGRYYVIAGVIVDESCIDFVEKRVYEYKRQHFIGEYCDAEIHVYNIWQNKEPFHRIDLETKRNLLRVLYYKLEDLPITTVSVVIDKKFIKSHYPEWKVFDAAWTFITERFDSHISENLGASQKGMMIVDRNSKMPDKQVTAKVNHLRKYGSHVQSIKYIHEEPLFVPSHDRMILQLADAIAYCTLKRFQSNVPFDPYWCNIRKKFRKSSSGEILGYGLKVFPLVEIGAI